jgi:hypothetical protein
VGASVLVLALSLVLVRPQCPPMSNENDQTILGVLVRIRPK